MKKKYGIVMLLFLPISVAYGQVTTVADIANGLVPGLDGVTPMLGALSYIFGIIFGIKGILKLKEHNESKGQIKLHTPIVLLIASVLFLSLPQLLTNGVKTFGFNTAQQSSSKY